MWIGEQKWNLGCSCVNLSGFSEESPVRCNQFSLCHLHLRVDNRQDYNLNGPLFWQAWNHFRRQRECLWVVKQVKGVLYLTWLLSGRMLSSHRCRNMSFARHQAFTTWWILVDTWYLSFFLFSCPLGDPGGQLWEISVQNEKDKSIWNSSQWISTNSANFDMTLILSSRFWKCIP